MNSACCQRTILLIQGRKKFPTTYHSRPVQHPGNADLSPARICCKMGTQPRDSVKAWIMVLVPHLPLSQLPSHVAVSSSPREHVCFYFMSFFDGAQDWDVRNRSKLCVVADPLLPQQCFESHRRGREPSSHGRDPVLPSI